MAVFDTTYFYIGREYLPIVQDEIWLGMDIYKVTDINLLITWYNKTILFAADQKTRQLKDLQWQRFHAALWIRINQLHPKELLRFEDITNRELLKRVA